LTSPQFGLTLARAVAEAASLASTLPLGAGGNMVHIVRAAIALVLVPVFLAVQQPGSFEPMLPSVLHGAMIGAALGLGATVVFGAVVGAGSTIDAALMWSPLPDRAAGSSPIAFLYQTAFITAFFASGGFTSIVNTAAHASAHFPVRLETLKGVETLGKLSLAASVTLAAPALLAQTLASVVAGIAARAAPQVGSMMLSAPLICGAVALALLVGASVLFHQFVALVQVLAAFYNT
jgi:type III secretory pathway component EscT